MSKCVSIAGALAMALALTAPAGAVTKESFALRSGADLVALCSTPPDDPLFSAAIHLCHGFGAGTYQTIQAMTHHEKLTPLFCPPTPPPTRNEGLQRFLEWAKRSPQHASDPPAEFLGRFLVETFPCPKASK